MKQKCNLLKQDYNPLKHNCYAPHLIFVEIDVVKINY